MNGEREQTVETRFRSDDELERRLVRLARPALEKQRGEATLRSARAEFLASAAARSAGKPSRAARGARWAEALVVVIVGVAYAGWTASTLQALGGGAQIATWEHVRSVPAGAFWER